MKKKFVNIIHAYVFLFVFLYLTGCSNQDPNPEDIPELITKVILKFTPQGGGADVIVSATDPDFEGAQDLQVDGPIDLLQGVTYDLSIELINGLYSPGDIGYDLTSEVEEEGDEHQFFFGFTDGSFSSPTGTGNIKITVSDLAGNINYNDMDTNNLPIGLSTTWTAVNSIVSSKEFRVVLKHQPKIKSSSSSSLDGETDLDLVFVLNIK